MSFAAHNTAVAEAAIAYVRRVANSLSSAGIEPRFDIHFTGFGTGGTMNVPTGYAVRYLTDLAAADDPHYRYRTRIKELAVSVHVRDKTFPA